MFIVTVRLRRVASMSGESAHRLHTIIKATATPETSLEYVYVQTDEVSACIVLFLLSPDLARAEATAAALVDRARSNGLVGWQPVTCEAELILPLAEAAFEREL